MANEHNTRVFEHLDSLQDELVSVLCDTLRIPSLNLSIAGPNADQYRGKEGEVSRYLGGIMEKLGLSVDLWEESPGRTNAAGYLKGSGGGKSLIFNGHVDVVDPGDLSLWTVCAPYEPCVQDGKVYGRGAADMKGGIVSALMAIKALRECGIMLKGDITLQCVVGEEMMEHELGTTSAVRRGYRADGAVVVEPTAPPKRLAIAPACCNVGYLVIQIQGKATHACLRGSMTRAGGEGEALGVSAIDKAAVIYEGLRRLDDRWGWAKKHPLYDAGHFNIHPGVVSGGACGAFAVADECRMEYSVWAPPQEDPAAIRKEIEDAVLAICQTDEWLREHPPVMFWPAFWPSYDLPVDSPLCKAAMKASEAVLNEPAYLHGFVGSNDASWLTLGGTPALSLGPGNLMNAHAPNEYVEISELMDAAKIYAALMLDWCEAE
ncbi:MAG: ArgE/DapE family deacylase [Clostridia bacterium]|nr:ArgE/DapE family deacylase [Clostridia bacterium]